MATKSPRIGIQKMDRMIDAPCTGRAHTRPLGAYPEACWATGLVFRTRSYTGQFSFAVDSTRRMQKQRVLLFTAKQSEGKRQLGLTLMPIQRAQARVIEARDDAVRGSEAISHPQGLAARHLPYISTGMSMRHTATRRS